MTRLRQAGTIGGALALGSALLFIRTLVLAMMLPAADYGRAAVLAVMMSVVELLVATGIQVRVFQHPAGDDPRTLDALHGLQLMRGVAGALIVLVLAWPMAVLVGMPGLWLGFAAMAALPLILCTANLDPYRQMRSGHYGAQAVTVILPALISLLSIWPLAMWLGDWRAFIGMQIVHALTLALMSRAVATHGWHPAPWDNLKENVRFVLPMMATGVLVLAAMQGDRVLVARAFSETTLAGFAVAATLTVPIAYLALRSISSFIQPKLAQMDDTEFADGARTTLTLILVAAFSLLAGCLALGPSVIALLFNADLQSAAGLVGAVAAVQVLWLIRSGVCVSLLARGDGISDFLCNLPRLAALAVGAIALSQGAGLMSLIQVAAMGEMGALLYALIRLRPLVPARPLIREILPLAPLILAALLVAPGSTVAWAAICATPFLAFVTNHRLRAVTLGLRLPTGLNRHDPNPL